MYTYAEDVQYNVGYNTAPFNPKGLTQSANKPAVYSKHDDATSGSVALNFIFD